MVVGFAAESHRVEEYAKKKLKSKNFDFIVANNICEENAGFASETNHVKIFSSNGKEEELPMMEKSALAVEILDRVTERLKS